MQHNLHRGKGVEARSHIVDHYAGAFWKPFQVPYRPRFYNVEPSKKYKAQQQRFPRDWSRDKSDELPGHLVDNDELRIFQPGGARDFGGCGNADQDYHEGQDGGSHSL